MLLELLIRTYESVVRPVIKRAYGRMLLRRVGRVGTNVRIHGRIAIMDPEHLSIGDHVRIGSGCFFFCKGNVNIGSNTQISRNVVIYSGNHNIAGDAAPYDDKYVLAPVNIGQSVWIGMNAAILPGVTIGDGAVIGLGTVISKDVPSYAVVVGAAQRVVKNRDVEHFLRVLARDRLFGRLWPDR